MALSYEIREAWNTECRVWLTQFQRNQSVYRTGHRARKYWRGAKGDSASRVTKIVERPDGLDDDGTVLMRSTPIPGATTADMTKGCPAISLDWSCNAYDGPQGKGYFVTFVGIDLGAEWRRTVALGPEQHFTHNWRELRDESLRATLE